MPTVWKIVTVDGAYIGLRPRGSLTDFDKSSLSPDLAKELQSKTAPISESIHKTLRAHHSEIWQLQPELRTGAENPMPHEYSMMRVDPGPADETRRIRSGDETTRCRAIGERR